VVNSDDMKYCPKNDCGKICVKSCYSNKVNCLYCFNQYCYMCDKVYKDRHRCKKEDLVKYIPDELRGILGVKYEAKPCPKCKIVLEKHGGCATTTCTSCKTVFCWKCLKKDDDIEANPDGHRCSDYDGPE